MYVDFDNLKNSNLVVDCVYKSGKYGNVKDDPINLLCPKVGNLGGFRKALRNDDRSKVAYVVLYTSMEELEWPDFLDEETGIFRYYGDNRKAGKVINDTKAKGNKLLEEVFSMLNGKGDIGDIPPFLIFKKNGDRRDVKFLGLAAPGNPKISSDRDLISFWRTIGENRFQNYEAYFTILDTHGESITREWLEKLVTDHENSLDYAPKVWKKFIKNGRNGIVPLKAPKIYNIPTKAEQLQCDEEGQFCLQIIRDHYAENPYGFEACATEIIYKMDNNFVDFTLTRPWRDGGHDAIGYYSIKTGGKVNYSLNIDCAVEAKCYGANTSVGVKQMSRLISRIRYRQFGILITTSYVDGQAYREVVEDGHPILIVTATDIAAIFRRTGINSTNIYKWLKLIDSKDTRIKKQ